MDTVWTQDGLRMDSGETLEGPEIDPGGTRDRPELDHGWTRDGHSLSLELQAYFLSCSWIIVLGQSCLFVYEGSQ